MDRLIEALRSGRYQKGRYHLKQIDGGEEYFCALGVALDISGRGTWVKETYISSSYLYYKVGERLMINPGEAAEILNIPERLAYRLVDMNDHEGKSFLEIAGWLEQTCKDSTTTV